MKPRRFASNVDLTPAARHAPCSSRGSMKVTLQFRLIAMALAAVLTAEQDDDHAGSEEGTTSAAAPSPQQFAQKTAA
jgi:hypothetical protein